VPNEFLVPRPVATLFIRRHDDAMQGMRLFRGDRLIADRSMMPSHGRMVVARVMGEVLVRRLLSKGQTGWLKPENPDYPAIELQEGLDYAILGVVRHEAHSV
jgi:DNA polymerase V